jgi:hypothetical protein
MKLRESRLAVARSLFHAVSAKAQDAALTAPFAACPGLTWVAARFFTFHAEDATEILSFQRVEGKRRHQ